MSEAAPIHRFPCPGCSADMEFDPQSGAMKCPYCGQTREVAEAKTGIIPAHRLADFESRIGRFSDQALEVSCSGCGGSVVFTPPEVAGSCSFCGAQIVAQPKAADPLVAPDGVLPASIPKEDALVHVKKWLRSRWFAPNALKTMARQEGVRGVYLPFWIYDCDTHSRYRGERGDYYYTTEVVQVRDSQGRTVNETRQVRHTRWRPSSGNVARAFADVLVPATESVSVARLNALEPWDLESMRRYEPGYLSGFRAQRYQVDVQRGFGAAQQIMEGVIRADVRRDIGGDEQRVHSIDTSYVNEMFRHLLLPVWIGAYRFHEKVFQVMVNARTGEVQGERPYSVWKIVLLVAVILLVIVLIVILKSAG